MCVRDLGADSCIQVLQSPSSLHLSNSFDLNSLPQVLHLIQVLLLLLLLLQVLPATDAGVCTSSLAVPTQASALGVKKQDI